MQSLAARPSLALQQSPGRCLEAPEFCGDSQKNHPTIPQSRKPRSREGVCLASCHLPS